jgi:hypothetical protein
MMRRVRRRPPFAHQGLDEALGLAVGLGGAGPGAEVADAKPPQHLGEEPGDIAGAVVGHHPFEADAALLESAQRPDEETGG